MYPDKEVGMYYDCHCTWVYTQRRHTKIHIQAKLPMYADMSVYIDNPTLGSIVNICAYRNNPDRVAILLIP